MRSGADSSLRLIQTKSSLFVFLLRYSCSGVPWWLSSSPLQCRRCGLIPGLGRSPGEGNATHSSILAWEIPWTEKPGGLQSMGSQRAGNNGVTFTFFSQHILPGGSGGGRRGCSRDDSQTSDWGCWKPKIQLIEKEFRRKSWWGVEVRW